MSFLARSVPRALSTGLGHYSSGSLRYGAAVASRNGFATQPSTSQYRGKYSYDLSKTLDPSGKDVIAIIKEEHKTVDGLFSAYQKETQQEDKQGIANNIIKLLSMHGSAEEMSVYPFIAKKLPNGQQMVQHALTEHQRMKEDLYALDNMKLSDAGYDAKLQQLVKDTQHHVKEEETTILPALQKHCSKQEMEEMTRQFISVHAISPSRPHPSAPNTPPANIAANTASVPLDAARDIAAGRFAA